MVARSVTHATGEQGEERRGSGEGGVDVVKVGITSQRQDGIRNFNLYCNKYINTVLYIQSLFLSGAPFSLSAPE